MLVPVGSYCCDNQPWEERVYVVYTVQFIIKGSPDRSSRQELKKSPLLPSLLPMACPACLFFFYTSQDHQPRDDTSHSRLKPVTSIVNQENDPHTEKDLLQANAVEAFSCLRFPLPKWLWLMSSWQDKKPKNKTNQQKARGSKLRSFNPDSNKTRVGLKTEQCG